MYPFGHIAVILLFVRRLGLRYTLLTAFFAVLPDADMFLPVEHRSFMHSFLFLFSVALACAPFKLRRYAFIGIGSHILIDMLDHHGVAIFYPEGGFYKIGLINNEIYLFEAFNDIYYAYLNRSFDLSFFIVGSLFALVGVVKLGRDWRAIFLVALFFISGSLFYLNIKTYKELPFVPSYEFEGKVVDEFGILDDRVEIFSHNIKNDSIDLWCSKEYIRFEYPVKSSDPIELELLSRGIPSSSLIVSVDGKLYRTVVNSTEFRWNRLGSYKLKKGLHSFKVQQYDTQWHDSNIEISRIRVTTPRTLENSPLT